MSKIKSVKYSKKDISKLVLLPSKDANKYSRGTAFIVAGSKSYPGAAVLCSRSAERSGSGYVKVFTEKSLVEKLAINTPSIPVASYGNVVFDSSSKQPSAWLIGPGFVPGDSSAESLLINALVKVKSSVIIDGGVLSLLSGKKVQDALVARAQSKLNTVITPHMGEAESLLNSKISTKDMQKAACELSRLFKCVCVLKGPSTIICDDKFIYTMKKGSPALAKAGSGDVLAGILVGICCQQRINDFDACVLATNVHAQAANIASKKLHLISVSPQDFIDNIPASFSFFN